jgi:heat shock protein HtpX
MNQRQWIPMEDSAPTNARRLTTIPTSIVLGCTSVGLIIGLVVGQPFLAAIIALFASAGLMWNVRRNAEDTVLSTVGGRSASETEHARLFNVIEGLCVVGGDQRPAVRVVDVDFPVALAVAMPGSAGTVVVSTGFVASMGRVETEAVMAHLMWRIRSGDISLSTYLLALSALLGRLGLTVVARYIVKKVADERVVLFADLSACQATRYPPALISALEIIFQARAVPAGVVGAQALWFATPALPGGAINGASNLSSLGFVRPSILERIALLKEI